MSRTNRDFYLPPGRAARENWKTQVRQEIFRRTHKTGWEYPPGLETALSSHALEERPIDVADALIARFFS